MTDNFDSCSDEDLVKEIVTGNEDAFRVLHGRYEKLVFYHVGLHFSFDEIEDVAQEIFENVYKQIKNFDPQIAKFKTFLISILKNQILYNLRKKERMRGIFVKDSNLDVTDGRNFAADLEQKQTYEMAMKNLSLQDRTVLDLRVEGYKLEEIAQGLKISYDAARASSSRGIKKLKKYLGFN